MTSVCQAFDRICADRAQHEALWSRAERRRLSFARLDREARHWQSVLPPGDRRSPVALAVGNRVAFVTLFLALRRLGRPVVTVDRTGGLAEKVARCRSQGIAELLHTYRADASRGVPGLRHDRALAGTGVRCASIAVERPAAFPAGTALVKLTSGSTGAPVGLCFDEASLLTGIGQIGRGMAIDHRDRVLIAIPLSHSYGFDNGVLSLLVLGTPLVLEPSIYPSALVRSLCDSEATVLPLVPPLVHALAHADVPTDLPLRRVICAGGVLRPEVARAFADNTGYRIHDFYGSSETGGIAFETAPGAPDARGTVGHPLPGVNIDLEGDDHRVTVRSAANRIGYLGQAEPVADRAVRTGDTAVLQSDGRLRLTGRTADILNIGGRKLPAARVEDALRALDGVRDAAAVGVDDPVRGDRVVAFVVTDRWPLDTRSVPSSSMPRELRRIDALPHNERGKLDREALRRLASDRLRGTNVMERA